MRAPAREGRRVFSARAASLATVGVAAVLAFTGAIGGCRTLPVAVIEPDTRTTVSLEVRETAVDKIDLLFAIDNSASMGDKQQILSEAIPDLLERFVVPDCVNPDDPKVRYGRSVNGACAQGELEFKPITDIHIGIVSSSLGGRGSDACKAARNDDKGRLLNVSGASGQPIAEASPSGFLAWLPTANAPAPSGGGPAITDVQKLVASFQDLVRGVGESGCGYEAQTESWYRFLVQPDPYDHIEIQGDGSAKLVGVDETILRERKAFLRPDSLLAIIQVTDENESTVDPLSVGGRGWVFSAQDTVSINGVPHDIDRLKATAACATNPESPDCGSCLQTNFQDLPECKPNELAAATHSKNLRFFDMKRRFGIDPRFPLSRYVRGLGRDANGASLPAGDLLVPNRDGEHPTVSSVYTGTPSCTNPLFAASLPDSASAELCKLPHGGRSPSLVYFATITGVAPTLLHFDPNSTDASKLTDADWTKILGKDPIHSDTTGASPLAIESATPRAGLDSKGDDGVHSREWDTRRNGVYNDLQYACTFPLKSPRVCTGDSCECTASTDSPLCSDGDRTQQVRAKAYPGVHSLALAKAAGDNGIVASICPVETSDTSSVLYGYRPAVRAITDRVVRELTAECLSRPLSVDADGYPPCVIVEALPDPGGDEACDAPERGLSRVDAKTRARFIEAHRDSLTNLENRPICQLAPIVVPGGAACTNDDRPGFCYVQGASALSATKQKCANAILFSKTGKLPKGGDAVLECITSSAPVTASP